MFFAVCMLFFEFIMGTTRSRGIPWYYSSMCWIILNNDKIIRGMCYFMGIYWHFKYYTEVVYCMDGLTEMSLRLQDRISGIEEKIKYHQEQLLGADRDFKEVLTRKAYHEQNGTMDEWQRQYLIVESALKDSNTNLNSEKRMLNILKAKLESGDYAMTSTSSAVKRKITD